MESREIDLESLLMQVTESDLMKLAERLFPINRSITGKGLRETLEILSGLMPNLELVNVPSGTKVFDWTVPDEWEIVSAEIRGPSGEKIIDLRDNNLHVVGYSIPVDREMELEELLPHIHSLPKQPDAIPYVTSYYKRTWGFCMSDIQKQSLKKGRYKVSINSRHFPGSLTYGQLILPGQSKNEILFSTYICHPSMANNEISGPVVLAYLSRIISALSDHRFTYRFVFVPETIGSLAFLSKELQKLKHSLAAGFNITCIGDERAYSYLPSRSSDTFSDRLAQRTLREFDHNYKRYTWLDRGSDERQYCAPGIDLPVASIMRSKYGEYPEYHTDLDKLHSVVTARGLFQSLKLLGKLFMNIESSAAFPRTKVIGEPQLGKRDMYPTTSIKGAYGLSRIYLDFISYSDGKHSLQDIAELIKIDESQAENLLRQLIEADLIESLGFPMAKNANL